MLTYLGLGNKRQRPPDVYRQAIAIALDQAAACPTVGSYSSRLVCASCMRILVVHARMHNPFN
jgi:hypothetical protein